MSDPVQAYAALHEQWKQENKGTFEWWLFTKYAELREALNIPERKSHQDAVGDAQAIYRSYYNS